MDLQKVSLNPCHTIFGKRKDMDPVHFVENGHNITAIRKLPSRDLPVLHIDGSSRTRDQHPAGWTGFRKILN